MRVQIGLISGTVTGRQSMLGQANRRVFIVGMNGGIVASALLLLMIGVARADALPEAFLGSWTHTRHQVSWPQTFRVSPRSLEGGPPSPEKRALECNFTSVKELNRWAPAAIVDMTCAWKQVPGFTQNHTIWWLTQIEDMKVFILVWTDEPTIWTLEKLAPMGSSHFDGTVTDVCSHGCPPVRGLLTENEARAPTATEVCPKACGEMNRRGDQ